MIAGSGAEGAGRSRGRLAGRGRRRGGSEVEGGSRARGRVVRVEPTAAPGVEARLREGVWCGGAGPMSGWKGGAEGSSWTECKAQAALGGKVRPRASCGLGAGSWQNEA